MSSEQGGWMVDAMWLASRGRFTASPNPMVGAVVVREGQVVGKGWHRRAGKPHAEATALKRAGEAARGATLYVTLEPCAHTGRTPPCVDAIVRAGVSRVIVGSRDPNPASGPGMSRLRRAGVVVEMVKEPWLREEAKEQNERFRTWVTEKRPFVLAKWAATLDGRIAASSGKSRWITGKSARKRALEWREEYDAILVGARTVRIDNPRLTRRLGRNPNPHRRIVLDGMLSVPESARLFRKPEGVIVATAKPLSHPKARRLARRGVQVWSMPSRRPGRVSLPRLLARLASEEVTGLLVEGGGETLWSFFEAGLVDRVEAYITPRILGGAGAATPVGGPGFPLHRTPRLRDFGFIDLGEGDDVVLGGLVAR